jgi:20S proteasome subunit alpha 6
MYRNQYDNDVFIWSPQGRIHQIEYAMEAVKQGSTTLGLKSKTQAVLIALKVSTYVCTYKYERTGKVSTYIGTCTNVQGNLFESDTQWSLMSIRLGGCQITE